MLADGSRVGVCCTDKSSYTRIFRTFIVIIAVDRTATTALGIAPIVLTAIPVGTVPGLAGISIEAWLTVHSLRNARAARAIMIGLAMRVDIAGGSTGLPIGADQSTRAGCSASAHLTAAAPIASQRLREGVSTAPG